MKHQITGAVMMAALAWSGLARAEEFSLWVRSDGSEYMPKLVDAFNAKGEHTAKLQIVTTDELVQKYAIASAGGSAPDALSLDLIYTPAFAEAGQLKDMTDFAKSLDYFDSLSKAHLSVATFEDRIYGLPFSGDASILLWNKDLYEKAGLDPEKGPKSWAEIEDQARTIAGLGDDIYGFYFSGQCGGCAIFTFAPLIWASGGDLLQENGRKATLTDPKMVAAVEFYRGMVEDGLVPAGAETDGGTNFFSAFANGNIGIAPSGSFAIGALDNRYPDLNFGVTFLPGQTEGEWSSFAGGDNIVISHGTPDEKVSAIEAFIQFAYSLEGQTILANNGVVPVRGDIAKEALKDLDDRYAISAEAMAGGHTPYTTLFNDLINSRNGPWITALSAAWFASSADKAKAALEAGEEEMQSIIDSAN
ncbi:sugar ABC transporter substrate-binding protein [Fulvimarina sp. 2208YS6-2-32]|uniref:Sugar ABC transporter substrate-binding protein n=1 Tax=Fulvimarina uroteuthidis TaxID=3098149 RepID=A0ABU5I750_9HYPH|nr:sugar ABC transporter substrate-binding protein [Fulvimarina sp. 2208YS6-2-32]MDY8111041.1 sugar ABC transporter substrate-binding protein [Fulvimarina sp. 2208YS6-2-32]